MPVDHIFPPIPTNAVFREAKHHLAHVRTFAAGNAASLIKRLSKHSTGAYIDLCNGVGVHSKSVLGKGAADYDPEMRLVTTIAAFDAPEKSREHPSSDAITFQLSAKAWREGFNADSAIRGALEVDLMGIKAENTELLTEMKALRELEATRS